MQNLQRCSDFTDETNQLFFFSLETPTMQQSAQCLEKAQTFERLAAEELDPETKKKFEKQAADYRKIAERRAAIFGLQTLHERQ
jgi:hypothetical protein